MSTLKKLILFGFISITGFLLITTASFAHQNAGGTCYHAPNQWVQCCGANFCSGCDLDNTCTTCYVDGNGNESGCYSQTPTHSANDNLCTDNGLGTDSCPIDQCNPVGADCSAEAVFQLCSDGTPCQWGHKKCQSTSAGNRCSSLYTIDKDQCSRCPSGGQQATPTPLPGGDNYICTGNSSNPCGCTGSGCQNGPNTTDNRCCHRECNPGTGNLCKTVQGGTVVNGVVTNYCTTENASCMPVLTITPAASNPPANGGSCYLCNTGYWTGPWSQSVCDNEGGAWWMAEDHRCRVIEQSTSAYFYNVCGNDNNLGAPAQCGWCLRCAKNTTSGNYTFQKTSNNACNYNTSPFCKTGNPASPCVYSGDKFGATPLYSENIDGGNELCCTPSWSCTQYTACTKTCNSGDGGGTQTLYCTDGCGGSEYRYNQACNTQPCPYILTGHLYEDNGTCTQTTPYTAASSGFISTSALGPGTISYPAPGSGQYQLYNLLGGAYQISPNVSASLYRTSTCSLPVTKIVPPSIQDYSVNFFVIPQQTLTVVKIGTAADNGTVNGGYLNNINCGSNCTARFDRNSSTQLTASRGTSSVFVGWFQDAGGTLAWPTVTGNNNCRGTFNNCSVSLNTNKTIYAKFDIYYPPWLKTSGDVHVNQ